MKVRVKKYTSLMTSQFYHVECQEHDGNWIGCVKTVNKLLSYEIAKLIRKNPFLVHGMGFLFD